jgi:hypothetical protein
MDPVDALALGFFNNKTVMNKTYDGGAQLANYAKQLNLSTDELETSVWNLGRLELFEKLNMEKSSLTAFARELLRVVSD